MTPASIIVGSPMITAPSLVALPRAKMRKAFLRWREQRYNADHRGIPFELTLADWLSIWIGSGHYHQRGRRSGQYVMSRPGDTGPYSGWRGAITGAEGLRQLLQHIQLAGELSEPPDNCPPGTWWRRGVGNVAIVPCASNTVEAQSHRTWTAETRPKIAGRLKGNKNGLGHVASATARKRMRKGCKERSKTDWLANTAAANQSLAKRRKNSRGVRAAWVRRRAEEESP